MATAPRRRLVVHVTSAMGLGGLERVIETLCLSRDRERFDARVLCIRRRGLVADRLEAAGVPVDVLRTDPDRVERFAFLGIAARLRRWRADVVHTHNTEPMVDGGLGAWLAGVPTIIHTDHARDFPDAWRYMVAEHVMSYLVTRVVGVSEVSTENLHTFERIPRRKLETIPNGIVTAAYRTGEDRNEARRRLGMRADARYIGAAARFTDQKGLRYLLEAFVRIRVSIPDARVALAGDGPLTESLRAHAVALGVSDAVEFLGERSDIARFLRAIDVYALPSLWEGLPMVLLEAMAAGCPVVATSVGGVPSALRHEVEGLLVPPADPHALSAAVIRMLSDLSLRDGCVARARGTVERTFSAEAMTRRYEALYLRGRA